MNYELAAEYLLLEEDDENLVRGNQVNAVKCGSLRNRILAAFLLSAALPAHAIPPPPARPPLLREARMTVTVQLFEAHNGTTTNITELCKVSGKIPVFSDDGRAASFHTREILGCSMLRNKKKLKVSILGAKAVSKRHDLRNGLCRRHASRCCPALSGSLRSPTSGRFQCGNSGKRQSEKHSVQGPSQPNIALECQANRLAGSGHQDRQVIKRIQVARPFCIPFQPAACRLDASARLDG